MGSGLGKPKKEIELLEDLLAAEEKSVHDGPAATEIDIAESVIHSIHHHNLCNQSVSALAFGRRLWEVNRMTASSHILSTLFSSTDITSRRFEQGFNVRDANDVRALEAVALSNAEQHLRGVTLLKFCVTVESFVSRFAKSEFVSCVDFFASRASGTGKHVCPL